MHGEQNIKFNLTLLSRSHQSYRNCLKRRPSHPPPKIYFNLSAAICAVFYYLLNAQLFLQPHPLAHSAQGLFTYSACVKWQLCSPWQPGLDSLRYDLIAYSKGGLL